MILQRCTGWLAALSEIAGRAVGSIRRATHPARCQGLKLSPDKIDVIPRRMEQVSRLRFYSRLRRSTLGSSRVKSEGGANNELGGSLRFTFTRR